MHESTANRILIIDDEKNMLHMLAAFLGKEGYQVVTTTDGRQGIAHALEKGFDYILCDLKMPGMDGLQFLDAAKDRGIDATIIMMSAFATVDTAVQAMKNGAYDFITKPFRIGEVLCVLEKAAERRCLRVENTQLRVRVETLENRQSFQKIIGESKCLQELLQVAEKAARHTTTVLITGESGTGKEMIARGIHEQSSRALKQFIAVNCGSIPENLLESEFFGYVRGAFTGADGDKKGLFAEADGGTLFLDEIGELPLGLQVKLLRVLQEREFRPLGSSKTIATDVRVLAATAKNLEEEILQGRFRQDLYYRLNVVILNMPPLRQRREDIHLLCEHFLHRLSKEHGNRRKSLSKQALRCLIDYSWPGNVRELENCMERATVIADGDIIHAADLPPAVAQAAASDFGGSIDTCSLKEGKKLLEKKLITKVLTMTNGNKSQAALILEVSYPSLLSKMKELQIEWQ